MSYCIFWISWKAFKHLIYSWATVERQRVYKLLFVEYQKSKSHLARTMIGDSTQLIEPCTLSLQKITGVPLVRDFTKQFLATRSQIITMNAAVSLRTKSVRYTCTWLDALEWCRGSRLLVSIPRRATVWWNSKGAHSSRRVHPTEINVSTLRHARAIRYARKNVNRQLILHCFIASNAFIFTFLPRILKFN